MNLMQNFWKPISKSNSTMNRKEHAPSSIIFYMRVTVMVQDPSSRKYAGESAQLQICTASHKKEWQVRGQINRPRGWKKSQRRLFPDLGLSRVCMEGFWTLSGPVEPPWWLNSEESACTERNAGDLGSVPGLGRIPWRRKYQPTPVFSAWRTPWTEALGRL